MPNFTDGLPSENERASGRSIVDYAQNDYQELRYPELIAEEELRLAWSSFADFAYFRKVKRGDLLLEFGAGLAANLLSVSKRAETWAVEPADIGRKMASLSGLHTASSLDELPSGIVFDFVLCRHVLEHVCDPKTTLEQLRRVIKTTGVLILVLPSESPDAKPTDYDIDHHLFCWNPQTISNLLQVCGFSVIGFRNEYFNGRRILLPLYRVAGGGLYSHGIRFLGRILSCKELVIEAKPL
jgi:SAM-dependent methyltransferase